MAQIDIEELDEIVIQIQDSIITATVRNHSELNQLDYASSGHTGFASSAQLTAEQNARIAADADLSDSISEVVDDLETETTARTNADILRSLITETGNKIDLEINSSDYKLVAKLYDKNNNLISTSSVIDLPLESIIISATYDSANKKIILTLQSGSTLEVPIGDLITGLATETYVTNKIAVETTARQNADTELEESIESNSEAIEQEILDRTQADTNLSNSKVDKITGKGLSTNDYTTEEKNKLSGIQAGAEVNVQSNWNQSDTTADDYIKNKPSIPNKTSDLTNDSGFITNAALSGYATSQDLQQGLATRQVTLSNEQLAAANSGITSTKVSQYDAGLISISDIQELIPTAATSSNQLADKDFVNSTVATQTANFLGTLDVVDDLELSYGATTQQIVNALNSHSFTSKTNNDYCYVINKDANSNTIYQRFKWNATTQTFVYEYTLNNSSFTAAQWSAISSGITAGKVTSYDSHIANTNNPHGVTKTQLGLGNVDNTSDANKPISTATQQAITNEATARQNADNTLNTKINKRLQIADSVVADANSFFINGIGKTNTTTLNLPLNDYEQDRWGVLEYVSENDEDNTGVQVWKCVAYAGSAHRGEIYTRTIISGTPTTWKKIAFNADIPTNNNQLINGAGYQTANDVATAISGKANTSDLSEVATSGSYNDLSNKPTIPTVNNGQVTIQKNSVDVQTFTLNQAGNTTVNLTVPTQASDVGALPSTTKYGASITVTVNTTDYKITTILKDQDGNTLGTAQVIDLPLESVVVSGSYNSSTKKVVLTLQNGSNIEFSVADLISGLQPQITSTNKLSADLIIDGITNKVVTQSEKATWSNKQNAITSYNKLPAENVSGLSTVATSGSYNDLSNKPTIPSAVTESTVSGWGFTKNAGTITGITMNGASKGTSGVVNLGTVITDLSDYSTTTEMNTAINNHHDSTKQDTLIPGTTIKTVNNNSLLGSGNLTIVGEKGEKGDTGDTGATGPQGPQGPAGTIFYKHNIRINTNGYDIFLIVISTYSIPFVYFSDVLSYMQSWYCYKIQTDEEESKTCIGIIQYGLPKFILTDGENIFTANYNELLSDTVSQL